MSFGRSQPIPFLKSFNFVTLRLRTFRVDEFTCLADNTISTFGHWHLVFESTNQFAKAKMFQTEFSSFFPL